MNRQPDISDSRARRVRRSTTGFTLIEVMLVVVILGILSGMVAFRMTGDLRRRRDLAALKIESLLETLAHRHQLSQDRMALSYDPSDQGLQLDRFYLNADEDVDSDPVWRRDVLAQRVVISDDEIAILAIRFDGRTLPLNSFARWEIPVDEARPTVEIELAWGEEEVDLIQLLPHELRPMRDGLGLEQAIAPLEPVDLDAIGKDDESW